MGNLTFPMAILYLRSKVCGQGGQGEQGWRSGESARLPPMCPRFPDPVSYVD